MTRHATKHANDPWPIWKILAVTIATAIVGTALFAAYAYIPAPAPARSQPAATQTAATQPPATQPAAPGSPAQPPNPNPPAIGMGLGTITLLLGLMSWGVALTFAAWLGHRLYMRIPAWKRRQMFGRHR